MKKKLGHFSRILLFILAIVTVWFVWKLYSQKQPRFFPFNQINATYLITKNPTSGYFMVKYKGPKMFIMETDGTYSIFVGKTKYDLNKYMNRHVRIIKGDFVSSSEQCVAKKCTPIAGPYVVVNIDDMIIVP